MTREEITAFFEARQAAWTARNADALAATHTLDGTAVSPMFGELKGRDEIADGYRRLFEAFPDWQVTPTDLIIDGDRVAQPFVSTATHIGEFMGLGGTNRHGRVEGVLLCTLKDGLIAHERRQYDFTALLIQIGVLKSKPNF
jgi:uncharacterized protein (TIGR02246 family)